MNKYIVQLSNITVNVRNEDIERNILNDIELQIKKGEWIAILGKNGSGKSTLAKVVSGVLAANTGEINIDSTSILQLILQNPEAQIIGDTVYEDISFGMGNFGIHPEEMKERARQALDLVGLDVELSSLTANLSGGQKQLLSIAASLSIDADILIFDEATSMLDPMTRQQIMQVIKALHEKGKTIIWITQWMEELASVDRVIVLNEGEIVYEGNNQTFFYGEEEESSACRKWGFQLPFSVQVAYELMQKGYTIANYPITSVQLSEAVKRLCL